MQLVDLNGIWKMKRTDEETWREAQVPGSVYSDLLRAGCVQDPFYRQNEYEAMTVFRSDYIYTREFLVTQDMLEYDRIALRFEGLDTLCDITVNGVAIGTANNMHRTYEFDVGGVLREGCNTVAVLFRSPVTFIQQKQKELPLESPIEAVEGIAHIRKAHYMFGWDWGPQLPDMGVWRSVSITGICKARLRDAYITQTHGENQVKLDIQICTEMVVQGNYRLFARVISPDGETNNQELFVQEQEEHCSFIIRQPQLWWPHNIGGQPLYTVVLELSDGEQVLDTKEYSIGLRRLTVSQKPDIWGESFSLEINGISIFAMGANYVPEDNLLSRRSKEKTERLIQSCVKANFNCIRVWGGGYYPDDWFYDLCDRYGLIVWQDLLFACCVYHFDETFKMSVVQEVADNMKRLRHHASLGLWCGNNELEWFWQNTWLKNKMEPMSEEYLEQFERILPQVAKKYDPQTFYWRASPSSVGGFDDPNSEDRGDMHYWDVWHARQPFTAYRAHMPRFMSEFGIQSLPCKKTIDSFTTPEDHDLFSPVMESHQKNASCNEKIQFYIDSYFKKPKDFDSLVYVSQLVQAEGIRYGVEHWRRNRGRCMGTIYWQLNDCWPGASWSSLDYYGRWKALHYYAKKFYSPVLVSANETGTCVEFFAVNESQDEFNGFFMARLWDGNNQVVKLIQKQVSVASFTSQIVDSQDFQMFLDTAEKKNQSYLEYSLISEDSTIKSRGTLFFVRPKDFYFQNPNIEIKIEEKDGCIAIILSSNVYAGFVELSIKDADPEFSDNYFNLFPGVDKTVILRLCNKSICANDIKKRLSIRSIYDTIEQEKCKDCD